MIEPTVGRVVWYGRPKKGVMPEEPLAAIVAKVTKTEHADATPTYDLNLAVFRDDGTTFSATCVKLVQDVEKEPPTCEYCTWIPYQKNQAAKHS